MSQQLKWNEWRLRWGHWTRLIRRGCGPNRELKLEEICSRFSQKSSCRLSRPCGKCGRTNHTTPECRVGTNKCLWCGSQSTSLLPALKTKSCRQELPLLRPAAVGRAYVLGKKVAVTFDTVVSRTPFSISKPFCVLVDPIVVHSFTSTWYAM